MLPVGTTLLHVETGIRGKVAALFTIYGDVCVEWENGTASCYDEDFLLTVAEVVID